MHRALRRAIRRIARFCGSISFSSDSVFDAISSNSFLAAAATRLFLPSYLDSGVMRRLRRPRGGGGLVAVGCVSSALCTHSSSDSSLELRSIDARGLALRDRRDALCVCVCVCVCVWNPSWHTVRTRSGRAPSSRRAGAPRPAARTHHAASPHVFVFDVVPRAGPRSNTSIHGSVGYGASTQRLRCVPLLPRP